MCAHGIGKPIVHRPARKVRDNVRSREIFATREICEDSIPKVVIVEQAVKIRARNPAIGRHRTIEIINDILTANDDAL